MVAVALGVAVGVMGGGGSIIDVFALFYIFSPLEMC